VNSSGFGCGDSNPLPPADIACRADLWTMAGTQAVALTGGPTVPFKMGRTDDPDGSTCPPLGRLPDASQGAQHLRDVFYRMGTCVFLLCATRSSRGGAPRGKNGFSPSLARPPLSIASQVSATKRSSRCPGPTRSGAATACDRGSMVRFLRFWCPFVLWDRNRLDRPFANRK
jgi:hypothetical protein